MKSIGIRCLVFFMLSLLSFSSLSGGNSNYGDIIVNKPEYNKITKPNDEDDSQQPSYHYPYHGPYYRPAYSLSPVYYQPSKSEHIGLPGAFYLGLTIGDSKFDYDDNDDGDATTIRFGYRPKDSHIGYEMSFFDSGDSEVTSLTDIEIQVDTINLALMVNSSRSIKSRLNLFGQGGIYFADTTLTGPADSVSVNSNGFLLAVGVEILLDRHFSLRADASNLFNVEDFANDESILSLNFGGNFIF